DGRRAVFACDKTLDASRNLGHGLLPFRSGWGESPITQKTERRDAVTTVSRSACGPVTYEASVLLTWLNVVLTLLPSAPTTETIATTIRASITAYSTAVGPSSLTRKLRTLEIRQFIACSSVKSLRNSGRAGAETFNKMSRQI